MTHKNTLSLDHMEMYYETHGQGSPLVLLHPYTQSGTHWDPYLAALAQHHLLIVPDLRGHGRSTNETDEFTHRQAAKDIYALLDILGIKQFKAMGYSSGGMTLLHMATQQSSRVEAMVLIATAPYLDEQARAFIQRHSSLEDRPEEWWEDLRQRHQQGDAQIRSLMTNFRGFLDRYDDMNFTEPYLGTITARTLIIHGDRDPEFKVSNALQMYQSIPRSYLWVLPNGGHWPLPQSQDQVFTKTVLEFLRGDWER